MCSTPPAICTSSQPAAMLIAASLIAWRLEAQLRLIVTPAVSFGQSGDQRRDPRDVVPLLPLLLNAAPAHVLDRSRVDAGALHQRLDDVRRQVVGADVAIVSLVRGRAPDRRAGGVDDHGLAHRMNSCSS